LSVVEAPSPKLHSKISPPMLRLVNTIVSSEQITIPSKFVMKSARSEERSNLKAALLQFLLLFVRDHTLGVVGKSE
jgi:hypothetical protein